MGGIGQGIVIALTQRDFDVVVCDQTSCVTERSILRSPNVSQPMRPLVRTSPSIRNDLADPGDLPRFVDAIFTAFGHIECLVNNAGLSAKSRGDLFDVSAES
jgi:NAD(P)-dependent dehydrogenase (short-subunit alcohol dehydrogenase family)